MTLDGSKPKPDIARAAAAIAARAAAFPETTEDQPWGHRAFKVKGKTFLFLATEGNGLSISVKLPESGVMALSLPFAEPTGYGLGKSGWVSARWNAGKDVPLSLVAEWLDESYRAIAPKKLLAARAPAPAPSKPTPKRPKPRQPKKGPQPQGPTLKRTKRTARTTR